MSKVGIVTVMYNSECVLPEYFESLENQKFKDFTLYIIDNNSPDHSLNLAKELSTQVSFKCVFLPQNTNWGIAKGNNIGIIEALKDQSNYVLLSNNDVVLNHDDTLEVMVNKMDNSDFDILCPKIYHYSDPKIIWAAGGNFVNYDTNTSHYGAHQIDNGQFEEERSIRYTPTCFVIIRSDVFSKIGYMDEWYFVYYDDTDFIYRANKAGLKIYYTPQTSILHNESSSTGRESPFTYYYFARNRLYFVRKHRPNYIFWIITITRYLALLKHKWLREDAIWKAELKGLNAGLHKSLKSKRIT